MKYWWWIGWLLLAAACNGAGGEPDSGYDPDADIYPPDFWDPGDRPPAGCAGDGGADGCSPAAVDCLEDPCLHGECVEAGSADWCRCEEGYAGELCDACAEGYLAQGLQCLPAGGCADSPCVFGTCRPQAAGGFVCDCQTGYTGRLCDACAPGYHVEDMRCVPD